MASHFVGLWSCGGAAGVAAGAGAAAAGAEAAGCGFDALPGMSVIPVAMPIMPMIATAIHMNFLLSLPTRWCLSHVASASGD
jgi:hypothetical protein